MSENIDDLIEEIRKRTKGAVSESRYEHSVRVAETAMKLCQKYGLDEKIGYLTGISHDMCKALPEELLISISSRDGMPVTELEKKKPALLHGRAAAVKLQEDFNVADPSVIEAVQTHTFGKVGMCDLSKVLFVADKIEPGRPHVDEEYLKRLKKLSLNELILTVLKENVDYLEKKGKSVAPQSLALLEWLQETAGGEYEKS